MVVFGTSSFFPMQMLNTHLRNRKQLLLNKALKLAFGMDACMCFVTSQPCQIVKRHNLSLTFVHRSDSYGWCFWTTISVFCLQTFHWSWSSLSRFGGWTTQIIRKYEWKGYSKPRKQRPMHHFCRVGYHWVDVAFLEADFRTDMLESDDIKSQLFGQCKCVYTYISLHIIHWHIKIYTQTMLLLHSSNGHLSPIDHGEPSFLKEFESWNPVSYKRVAVNIRDLLVAQNYSPVQRKFKQLRWYMFFNVHNYNYTPKKKHTIQKKSPSPKQTCLYLHETYPSVPYSWVPHSSPQLHVVPPGWRPPTQPATSIKWVEAIAAWDR